MLPELTNRILDDWNNLFTEKNKPTCITYLGIPGSIEGGTTTFLAFTDKNKKPAFAVKIHRHPDSQNRALNEKYVLDYLQIHGGMLAASVPKVILCEKIAGIWVIVLSIIEGQPMRALMTNDGVPELNSAINNINTASNWLAKLSRIEKDSASKVASLLKDEGLKTIDEFLYIFDLSKNERAYLNEVADNLDAAINGRAYIQHGDFCRHNILLANNYGVTKVGVIDWTDSKRVGFPLHDLFFFLTTYYLQVRKYSGIKGFVRAFEDTFLNNTKYNRIVKQCITEHCSDIGIDAANVETLFAVFLIERAIFEFRQVVRCAKQGSLPRFTMYLAGQENLDYHQAVKAQLWLHFFSTLVARRGDFNV